MPDLNPWKITSEALNRLGASQAWQRWSEEVSFRPEEVYGPDGRLAGFGWEWPTAAAMRSSLMQNMGGGVPLAVTKELMRQCAPFEVPPRPRIATWNVERPNPKGWKIPSAQRQRMAEVNADIWILTETHVEHAPTSEHTYCAFSPAHPSRRPSHERWVGIWSRWPLVELAEPPAHRRGSLAVQTESPWGPILIYGSVMAWANEPHFDDGRPAARWEVNNAEAERQTREWQQIMRDHPNTPLVVAGDFNQDRDGSGWYGSEKSRETVSDGLAASGLQCVTEFDAVAAGRLQRRHLVDHICLPNHWARMASVELHEAEDDRGQRLSDHPTVVVEIDLDPTDLVDGSVRD